MNQSHIKKQQMEYFSMILLFVSCVVFRSQVGDIGIGYLITAFFMYEMLWIVFGKNVSDTVGRIIRAKINKGKTRSARLVWKYSFWMQLVTGAVIGIALAWAGSYILSRYFGFIHSYYLIWFLGLAILLRMISEAFAGYLSGKNYDLAAGFGAIIRYTITLIMGVMLSASVKERGKKVAALLKQEDFASVYGNIGILITVVVAEIVVLVFLMIVRLGVKRKTSEYEDDYYQRNDNNGNVFTMIWKRRFVEGVNLVFLGVPIIILLAVLKNHAGTSLELAQNIGILSGSIGAPCAIFVILSFLISYPLAVKTIRFIKNKEMRKARTTFLNGFHLTVIYGVFGSSFLIAECNLLSVLLSDEFSSVLNALFIYGAFIILAASLTIYLLRVLLMNGHALIGLVVEIVSIVLFVVFLNLFIKSNMNILLAAVISILIFFVIQAIAYSVIAIFIMDMYVDPMSSLCIPVLVGAICSLANFFLGKLISPHLGMVFTVAFCFLEMSVLYIIILLVFRNINENELEYMPGKKIIFALGQLLHVM